MDYPGLTRQQVEDIRAGRIKDPRFFPCNAREAAILDDLKGADLDLYKRLRNEGATVTEALDKTKAS